MQTSEIVMGMGTPAHFPLTWYAGEDNRDHPVKKPKKKVAKKAPAKKAPAKKAPAKKKK